MSKRYIEDVLPLGELNKYAQRGGGVGSLNAMHPYFARRPLTASRAMTLAALVNTPRTEEERKTLEEVMVGLSREEWPDDPALLERARELIRQAHGGRAPRCWIRFRAAARCRWRRCAWVAKRPRSI